MKTCNKIIITAAVVTVAIAAGLSAAGSSAAGLSAASASAAGLSAGSASAAGLSPACGACATTAAPITLAAAQTTAAQTTAAPEKLHPKKILIIGDSMTGWLSDRLNAYGPANGFDTAAVIWDGSTIGKWADSSARIKELIAKEKPDALIISLGLNELLERNPQRYEAEIDKIVASFGNLPFVWVGPPSWPGRPGGEALNAYLEEKLGNGRYFNSSALSLPRQSATNPHPTQAGCAAWMDRVIDWLPASEAPFEIAPADGPTVVPATGKTDRPSSFLYRKMKDAL